MALLRYGLGRARFPLAAGGLLSASFGVFRYSTNSRKDALLCEEARTDPSVKAEKESKFFSLPSMPSMPSMQLPTLPDVSFASLTQSFLSLQESFNALHSELVTSPTSTRAQILRSAKDPAVHPELLHDASVRLSSDISHPERAFVRNRTERMRTAFADLMGVGVDEVDARDIPVLAVAGSGGGYRAMVNTLGSIQGMQEAGVWDTVMYTSAVSGSCWALNVLYTIGEGSIDKAVEHIKSRIDTPFLDPSTLEILTDSRSRAYLLSGLVLKEASESNDVSLVDLYGTLVSARLYIPSGTAPLSMKHLKISHQRTLTDDGSNPLPLYTMIRHEVPQADAEAATKVVEEEGKKGDSSKEAAAEKEKRRLEGSRWMWCELSPYEMGFDELGAWIPTWSVGRRFEGGVNVDRVPELSLTIFSGIFASAFCATLFSYFQEVKPILKTLPYFKPLEQWLLKNYESDMNAIHPFPPAELPNFLKGLEGKLANNAPEGLTKLDTLGFMDAGANLNVPYVPLFRRDCDIILAFDASADSQDLWFSRAEEYAVARDLRTWPRVRHANLFDQTPIGDETKSPSDRAASKVDEAKVQEAAAKNDARTGKREPQPDDVNPERIPEGSAPSSVQAAKAEEAGLKMPESTEGEPKLGRCNIWIGSTSDEETSCRNDNPTAEDVMARDGIALAYYPLVAGPELEDPGKVWSTWKFEYTAQETQQLISLSKANFLAGQKQLVTTLRGIWQRKRKQRLERDTRQ